MDMMTIKNERNGITMTMPQNSFWTTYGRHENGKAKLAAFEINKALCNDDREHARELLSQYDCVIEFFTDYKETA